LEEVGFVAEIVGEGASGRGFGGGEDRGEGEKD
jgi:hypothetical protein